jgi:hypothetical protein
MEDRIWQCHAGVTDVGDGLAEFIASELEETFDEEASDDKQLEEAIRVMEIARKDLRNVIEALNRRKS